MLATVVITNNGSIGGGFRLIVLEVGHTQQMPSQICRAQIVSVGKD
ncbi:hypothetical protein AB0V79_20265 [Mesorhizobium ciceri]|nr:MULTISPECIES: hypothetical protein [Mesorhizobium]MDF3233609.1 hypothetical protein [Mesorhizobium sp. DSM 30133]